MSKITLAAKYRPKIFSDVVEQSSQIKILEHQIKTETFKNCYLFSGKSGCVDLETEYLTKFGWKKISKYSGEEIAVYNKNGQMFFEKPSDFYKFPATKWFEIVSKYGINQKLSEEHRVAYITSKGNLYSKTMQEVYDNHIEAINGFSGRFITSFKYNGDVVLPFSDDYLRLLISLSADGSLVTESTGYWEVHIKKERKVERLESLLKSCKIEYKKTYQQSDESFRYWFYCKDGFKEFPTTWYRLNRGQLEIIGEECLLWDGSTFKRKHGLYEMYSTVKKCNADFIQFVFTACGYRSSIHYDYRNRYKNGVCYKVSRTKRVFVGIGGNTKVDIKEYQADAGEYKYCFTTSTSYWIARRSDRIFVTGNCGKTTVARIMANEVNKGIGEPIYIDCAKNNGVDDVRQLIDDSSLKSLVGKYKVFILDECFSKNTRIMTSTGERFISDIKVGDTVLNMVGNGSVSSVFKNRVFTDRLCCVTINGRKTITTIDHLFFTDNGWIAAKDLNKEDFVYVYSSLQKLREGVFEEQKRCENVQQRVCKNTKPQNIDKVGSQNLCNMRVGVSMQTCTHKEDVFKRVQKQINLENRGWKEIVPNCYRQDEEQQPNEQSRSYSKGIGYEEEERNFKYLECREGRKWKNNNPTAVAIREFNTWGSTGVCSITRNTSKVGISYMLQSRPRLSRDKVGDRGGWELPQVEKSYIERCEKDGNVRKFGVESVEVFKRGYNDELFSGSFSDSELSSEIIEMYDLAVSNHPSYYANGVLVHNCHQFSSAAFSSLLYTLENPKELSIFILCTTDPQKIPPTIINRVQRFDFKAISCDGIISRLKHIIREENLIVLEKQIIVDDSVYDYLAKLAEGGLRDALSMLDKCLSFSSTLTIEDVTKALGLSQYESMFDLIKAINNKNQKRGIEIINEISKSGTDLKQFLKQFYLFLVDINKCLLLQNINETKIPEIYKKKVFDCDKGFCLYLMREFMEIYEKFKWETEIKEFLTAKLIILCIGGKNE